jgi:Collagen triple helix repeat (20 copies)
MRISVLTVLLAVAMATAGCSGPKGDKGDKGDPGPAGPAGKQGEAGKNGAPGKDGKDGPPGKDGTDGFRIVRSGRTPAGDPVPAACNPDEVMISALCTSGGSYHGSGVTLGDGSAMCPEISGSPQPSAMVVCIKR